MLSQVGVSPLELHYRRRHPDHPTRLGYTGQRVCKYAGRMRNLVFQACFVITMVRQKLEGKQQNFETWER